MTRRSLILSLVHDSTPPKLKVGIFFLMFGFVIDSRGVLRQTGSGLHRMRRCEIFVHTPGRRWVVEQEGMIQWRRSSCGLIYHLDYWTHTANIQYPTTRGTLQCHSFPVVQCMPCLLGGSTSVVLKGFLCSTVGIDPTPFICICRGALRPLRI